jgi:hypothetical protein
MVNIWKVSTLVLAGALAFVVGRGAIAESIACDGPETAVPTAEQVTRIRLARGVAFLDRAEQEIEQATAAPARARTNALAQIAKARSTLELALNPEPEFAAPPPPPPKPAPLPRKRPASGTTTSASLSRDVVNPFLRAGEPTRPVVVHADIKDPWAGRN